MSVIGNDYDIGAVAPEFLLQFGLNVDVEVEHGGGDRGGDYYGE